MDQEPPFKRSRHSMAAAGDMTLNEQLFDTMDDLIMCLLNALSAPQWWREKELLTADDKQERRYTPLAQVICRKLLVDAKATSFDSTRVEQSQGRGIKESELAVALMIHTHRSQGTDVTLAPHTHTTHSPPHTHAHTFTH